VRDDGPWPHAPHAAVASFAGFLTRHAFTTSLPRRLADFLRRARGALRRSMCAQHRRTRSAALAPQAGDRLLAIEADPTFFDYLQAQTGGTIRALTLRQEFCGAAVAARRASYPRAERLRHDHARRHGRPLRCATLDALDARHAVRERGRSAQDRYRRPRVRGAGGRCATCCADDRPALLIECDARGDPDFGERCAGLFARLGRLRLPRVFGLRQLWAADGAPPCADTSASASCWPISRPGGCYYFDLLVMDAASLEPFAAAESRVLCARNSGEDGA
jgi:hypothetical protein